MTDDDQNEHPYDIDGCDQAADELADTAIDPEVVTAADRVARGNTAMRCKNWPACRARESRHGSSLGKGCAPLGL
jgi:hypothetical protein